MELQLEHLREVDHGSDTDECAVSFMPAVAAEDVPMLLADQVMHSSDAYEQSSATVSSLARDNTPLNMELDQISPSIDDDSQAVSILPSIDHSFPTFKLPSIVDRGNKPNMSLKQLVIMALVMSPGRTASVADICLCINEVFRYYRDFTVQQTLNGTLSNWKDEVSNILHQYDLPTKILKNPDPTSNSLMFHLPPGREWCYLGEPNKMTAKPFRLLDLPFELKFLIYSFVLSRPLPEKQGWIIDPAYTATRKANYRRPGRTAQCLNAKGPEGWELRTPPLDEALALLSVSHQVKDEAAPVFYRTNFFEFNGTVTLTKFLRGIPLRCQFIRNIVLHYDPPRHQHSSSSAFELLKETKLRNLYLFLDEVKLIERFSLETQDEPIKRLPGMKIFAELRGLKKVKIYGSYKRVSVFLGPITEPKKGDFKDEDEKAKVEAEKKAKMWARSLSRAHKEVKARLSKQAREARLEKEKKEKERRQREAQEEREARREEQEQEKEERRRKREQDRKLKQEQREEEQFEKEKKRAEAAKIKAAKIKESEIKASRQQEKDKAKIMQIKGGMKGKKRIWETSSDSSSDGLDEDSESDFNDSPPPKRQKTAIASKSTIPAKAATPKKSAMGAKSTTSTKKIIGAKHKAHAFPQSLAAVTSAKAGRRKNALVLELLPKVNKSAAGSVKAMKDNGVEKETKKKVVITIYESGSEDNEFC